MVEQDSFVHLLKTTGSCTKFQHTKIDHVISNEKLITLMTNSISFDFSVYFFFDTKKKHTQKSNDIVINRDYLK